MFSFDSLALLTFLLHSLLLSLPVYSLPLDPRQAGNPPQTRTTVNTAVSPMGTVVVTCVLVFTSIKVGGKDAMLEVKTCTLTVDDSSTSEIISTSTRSTIPLSTTATLPPLRASSPTPSFSSNTRSNSDEIGRPLPTVTSTISTSTSTISRPETLTSSTSVQPSAAGVSGIGAVADSSMPGTKLSVLPIGLGVFVGISIIALIVVGLVTYERTKYRKAFRERQQQNKLAEAGAPMGYGGMN